MNQMNIPSPKAKLAGCVWLPRIIAKARMFKAGKLPPDYAAKFCNGSGVDGLFLSFFFLNREQIVEAGALNVDAVEKWFLSLPASSGKRIEEWNHIAENLGRPGFPMADRFPAALETAYKHLKGRGFTSVFEVLEEDDLLSGSQELPS